MKSKFLTLGVMLAGLVGMISCNKGMEYDDEAKAVENQQSIEKYLADSSITATKDSSGMYYVLRKANPAGAKPKAEEGVRLNFNGYTLDGRLVASSVNTDKIPFVRPYNLGFLLGGMERALNILRVGESATLFMPFYLAFGSYSSDNIPAYSVIKMNIEVVNSRSEVQQIDDFIAANKLTVSERTTDNLVIARTNTVTGDSIGTGKIVNISYKGKLLTGATFDNGDKPYSFTTGTGGMTGGPVIGFDRAIRKLRKGEKATIVFPSAIGYGKAGVQASGIYYIYPYSPISFDVEVL
ncbi:FKBP-type peptidyl-prolyl cis-trans isomerase [Dyadobacter subterraneus]|uniref:Peptidyl-prolyl cis-trans isomerase n=1 Tax=Dyadobacter subterraneus TaxID=2773304 RepID=A0ABR9WJH9_9BACT|nr:FKBP-type peptidyl-prolyl cis-trans isomerase [Dyadobacter subterraneus]MBE9465656.1 FKBP-type peptidyl-prolyl cis-trans isomerase [Dyadobacter subterraneus]